MLSKNQSVLFLVETEAGNARPLLRGKLPAKGLQQTGWRTKVAPVLYEEEKHTFNGWNVGEESPTPTTKYIVARPMLQPKKDTHPKLNDHMQIENMELVSESQVELVTTAREHGQYFFFDLDDDIWNIPDWNPASATIEDYRDNWISDVNASNGLIVSTWHIWYAAQKSYINVPIFICPNSCNYWDFPVVPYENEVLRVAWFGVLGYREKDLEPFIQEIRNALQGRREKVEFWHIGADFEGGQSIRDILRPFPVDIVERPWYNDIQDIITEIDCAIIPALNIPFNQGRSNALGLQLAAAGKPFLASRIHEYQLLNDTGIPCATDNFEDALSDMLDDISFRSHFKETAPKIIADHFSPKVIAQTYIKAFESCIIS
jgi:glycosyltransferase involved in cell wall biosynthesis